MSRELDTDIHGNVIMKPLVGWATHGVSDIAVLIVLEYLDDPAQAEAMQGETLQLALTAHQCLEVADALNAAANGILRSQNPREPVN